MEHGANRAKVVGLIPYRPFPEELDLMVFVGPRRFCELTDMNQVAIEHGRAGSVLLWAPLGAAL